MEIIKIGPFLEEYKLLSNQLNSLQKNSKSRSQTAEESTEVREIRNKMDSIKLLCHENVCVLESKEDVEALSQLKWRRLRVRIKPGAEKLHRIATRVLGGLVEDDQYNLDKLDALPLHVVTLPSELPLEITEPSDKIVVGLDSQVDSGTLCLLQLAFHDNIYIIDAITGSNSIMQACKPALESDSVTKIMHDSEIHSEALYVQYGIRMSNVLDTQVVYTLMKEHCGQTRGTINPSSFRDLVSDLRFLGPMYVKEEVRQSPSFWKHRPLTQPMLRAASENVRFFNLIYEKVILKLNHRALSIIAVRSALHCKCYVPGKQKKGEGPTDEILFVLKVPPEKRGLMSWKQGSNIMSLKETASAEIFFRADKVFVIGPTTEVERIKPVLKKLLRMGDWR